MAKHTLESKAAPKAAEMHDKLTMIYKEQVITNNILADILENREDQRIHEKKQAAAEAAKARATWMQVFIGVAALTLAVTVVWIDLAIVNKDHAVFRILSETAKSLLGG
jgi:hypothetical protein